MLNIALTSRVERHLIQEAIHKIHDKKSCPQTHRHTDVAPGRTYQRRRQNTLFRQFIRQALDKLVYAVGC